MRAGQQLTPAPSADPSIADLVCWAGLLPLGVWPLQAGHQCLVLDDLVKLLGFRRRATSMASCQDPYDENLTAQGDGQDVPGRTVWLGLTIRARFTLTLPSATNWAAAVRDFISRVNQSHLSRRCACGSGLREGLCQPWQALILAGLLEGEFEGMQGGERGVGVYAAFGRR